VVKITIVVATEVLSNPIRTNKTEIIAVANTSNTPSTQRVGASFSALEVVPLVVIGFEAYNHKKLENQQTWQENYHWPFMFFSAVLFWNFLQPKDARPTNANIP
jgi:hypothetical protein